MKGVCASVTNNGTEHAARPFIPQNRWAPKRFFHLSSKVKLAAFTPPVPFTFLEIIMPSCGKQEGHDSWYFPYRIQGHCEGNMLHLGARADGYHLGTWAQCCHVFWYFKRNWKPILSKIIFCKMLATNSTFQKKTFGRHPVSKTGHCT